jgi:hypothetical protein
MTRTDSLGQAYALTGAQAHASVNSTLDAAGDAMVDAAPAIVTPDAILTATITFSTTAFSIAYTPTPLSSGERLFVYASPLRSAGRSFESDYRLVTVTAAAAASPADVEAAYVARFGVPVVGSKVFLALVRYAGGFLSAPLYKAAVAAA